MKSTQTNKQTHTHTYINIHTWGLDYTTGLLPQQDSSKEPQSLGIIALVLCGSERI